MTYYNINKLKDKIELNFNICPNGSGRTYYEMNVNWKYVKRRIKDILDEKESCRETKITMIIALLENYREVFLRRHDEK